MTSLAQQIIARHLGLLEGEVRVDRRAPLTHQSNNLYDAWTGERHMIVKEYLKPDELEDAPLRESGAMVRLSSLDIAPRLVLCHAQTTPGFGPFVVYDWMEGQMWDRRHPTPDELERLAALWLELHSLPTDGLWMSHGYERSQREVGEHFEKRFLRYAEWVKAEYAPAQPAVDLCLSLIERRRDIAAELEQTRAILRFCRGDARFANVIARPDGRLGLVDWEDCGLRDPARDLADLLTGANQEDLVSWAEWQAFLRPYFEGRGTSDPGLERRVKLYLAIFPMLWLMILVSHGMQYARTGRLGSWTINEMAPNERLRRYLARAMAWPKMDFAGELDSLAGLTFFPIDSPA